MKSEIARLCVAFEKDSSLSLPACLLNNITSPPDCVEGAAEEMEKISSCLLCETVWLWRICAAAFLTCTIDPLQTGREPARRRPLHTRGLGQGPRRCTQLPNRGGCGPRGTRFGGARSAVEGCRRRFVSHVCTAAPVDGRKCCSVVRGLEV
jgi:hypothetical protein